MSVIPFHLRIVASDGTTVVGDLNDEDLGLSVLFPLSRPDDEAQWERYSSPRAHGDFTSGAPRDAAGDLVASVQVEGSSWEQINTRWATARGWMRAEWFFFLELEEDGVVTRWSCDRPSVTPGIHDPAMRVMVHQVRFHVQPNPTITTGG